MRIYLASSWRNPYQPGVVESLRSDGHEVYDFRHPPGGDQLGFSWASVDPNWESWTDTEYLAALKHPIAEAGFQSDWEAMRWAEACVLLLPSGRSAHLEAGYFVGARKPLIVALDPDEFLGGASHSVIELMYLMANRIVTNVDDLLISLEQHRPGRVGQCVYGCQDPFTCRFPHGGCGHCANARERGPLGGLDGDAGFLRRQAELRESNNAYAEGRG